ncbi:MAG: hypothetical protein WBE38_21065 [Terracidiphilus sp.]
MNDANRQGPGEGGAGGSPAEQPGVPQSSYKVVPSTEKTNREELYSFRAEMAPPPPPPPVSPTQAALEKNKTLLMAAAAGAVGLLVVLLIVLVMDRQNEAPAYIDLGTSNIVPAGLQARLVARWVGSAQYELRINPAAPQQLAGFSAVAGSPPHPLSVHIRLKGSSGVVCQRDILFPLNAQPEADPDHPDTLLPQKTFEGDTVQNVAAADGKIDEIVVIGPLNCPVKAYKKLEAWSFSSNFPLLPDQGDWLNHLESVAASERSRAAEIRARALIPKARTLTAPIEGDDVIVSDNPSRGSVETGAGRVFYLGKDVLREAQAEWQVFPVAIHFRCDIKSVCTLTRSGASMPLQARLVR